MLFTSSCWKMEREKGKRQIQFSGNSLSSDHVWIVNSPPLHFEFSFSLDESQSVVGREKQLKTSSEPKLKKCEN